MSEHQILPYANKLKVLTYNTLARLLCSEENFKEPNYDPNNLLFENRYSRIWNKLDTYIKEGYVICLQEVDTASSGQFQLDFKKRGYDFYFHGYGKQWNNFMGVAIAVPSSFNVVKVDKFRIADGKDWPKPSYHINSKTSQWMKYLSRGYVDWTTPYTSYKTWSISKKKWNFMITLEIQNDKGSNIFVSTLHMPCSFRNPSTMFTYAALARQHIKDFSNGSPYVLAGDFNICPNSDLYNFLLTGNCDPKSIRKDFPPEDTWNPNDLELGNIRSAVLECHGSEPAFTNYCFNSIFGNTEPFCDTLDYIFVSEHFGIEDTFKQPSFTSTTENLCPSIDEPSDHLLIWAELEY
jgi:mRNA deadenylase 3'-5' endonuclease subunit Ccr4